MLLGEKGLGAEGGQLGFCLVEGVAARQQVPLTMSIDRHTGVRLW